jgi:hypothetical protein
MCSAALAAGLGFMMLRAEDRRAFLPGATSAGHYQIELRCEACHVPGFERMGDNGVPNETCLECHQLELEAAADSHPVKKFRDPRNANLLDRIDAMQCVTCHEEHVPHRTRAIGVTMPLDYCAHCHPTIGDDRVSHAGLAYSTCASAGCHNFHDNLALYESFLVRHAEEPELLPEGQLPELALLVSARAEALVPDAPANSSADAALLREWESSAHAAAGVNCSGCHARSDTDGWSDRVTWTDCRDCHAREATGFLAGRHGMRLAHDLTPMTPDQARLPMRAGSADRELVCTSCHDSHAFDRRHAAVEACEGCHDDTHTRNYRSSRHFTLWEAQQPGGVSCAGCHLPRVADDGAESVWVQHNQNHNLRPNEKMIRTTCLACHGLGVSIDALADPVLIANNFVGRPATHIRTIDMAWSRELEEREAQAGSEEDSP